MKANLEIQTMHLEGTVYVNFIVIGDEDNWIQCREHYGDIQYKLRSRVSTDDNKSELPNYYECRYKEGYEEFMFQESLVWDVDFNFHLYCAIQKYFIDNLNSFKYEIPIKSLELEY